MKENFDNCVAQVQEYIGEDTRNKEPVSVETWTNIGGPRLPAGVDLVVLDAAIHVGVEKAMDLYYSTGNAWGHAYPQEPITVERYIAKFTDARIQYYLSRPKYKDSIGRCGAVMDKALEMARGEWLRAQAN